MPDIFEVLAGWWVVGGQEVLHQERRSMWRLDQQYCSVRSITDTDILSKIFYTSYPDQTGEKLTGRDLIRIKSRNETPFCLSRLPSISSRKYSSIRPPRPAPWNDFQRFLIFDSNIRPGNSQALEHGRLWENIRDGREVRSCNLNIYTGRRDQPVCCQLLFPTTDYPPTDP